MPFGDQDREREDPAAMPRILELWVVVLFRFRAVCMRAG